MCRTPQPCGVEMEQDAFVAKDDLRNVRQTLSRPDVSDAPYEETLIGEVQAAPRKKRGKNSKEKT